MRVKIVGAGSIGNHLAHAARTLGWNVVVCDIDHAALERMQTEIYPSRYGRWDPAIELSDSQTVAVGGFDLICIGTPPNSHIPLALQSLSERPKALLIEKPLCPPFLASAQQLYQESCRSATRIFVGYDHVVGKAARAVESMLQAGRIGEPLTMDVEFREHWGGIFKAHPWLNGPQDSYLGFWEQGGGASGEHSHAVNLWQHFAHVIGKGKITDVDARVNYKREGRAFYDDLCLMTIETEKGFIGRVVQDVISQPVRKRAVIQGTHGTLEWINGYSPEGDAVRCQKTGEAGETVVIPKKRPDDFIEELKHIADQLDHPAASSPIQLERGLDTMLVVAAAHASERQRCRIKIDYSRGYEQAVLAAPTNP
jgi:predicted dehydrogenase